ncbi:MAG: class I SAM-dependent methyltransferase [Clostridiales bacterium]|nr:class I SAM-dependent methyltransferase [Clostridiales bacterium]
MEYKLINKESWDKKVDTNDIWTRAVSSEVVESARNGEWSIVLTPKKTIPRTWFPEDMNGLKILCLASGGGQQGPILAATGADVTVLDYSSKQLDQDKMVASRDGLKITTVQGDMSDLSCFDDETFDMIVHPWSNCFIASVLPVWQEAFRVIKHGGCLLAGFGNPIEYIFDLEALEKGELVVRHSIPYSDLTSLSEEELKRLIVDSGEPICFGHSLEEQIKGQLDAGFLISGFYEDESGSPLNQFINTGIATKAIKL